MKTKILLPALLLLLLCNVDIKAQNAFPATGAAGIGTLTPNASSLLEINSTRKGLLISRMTLAQRNAIATPATGLLIYQINNTPGFYYYSGSGWKAVTPKSNSWSLTGNTGTIPGPNFIGTIDTIPLVFKVNNNIAGYIDFISGKGNTGFGYQTLFSNSSGIYNTANGYEALYSNTSGSFNTANGYLALYANKNGNFNTATGHGALESNTSGSYNSAIGYGALQYNTKGIGNVANGAGTLFANSEGSYNIAIGNYALYSNNNGYYNTAVGYYSLFSNSDGYYNTATGYQALYSNIAGYNTANGFQTLYSNNTGAYNLAAGNQALYKNTTGSYNTANGYQALYYNTDGNWNSATGYQALYYNIGSSNTAYGFYALQNNYTGNYNTAFGAGALYSNTTGSLNTAIGYYADVTAGLVNATALGNGATANASNKVRIGNSNITIVESAAGSWIISDGRFKNNITDNVKGLEFIKLLKPVTYNFDTRKFEEFLMQNYPDSIKQKRLAAMDKEATAKASAVIQSGFVAQDVAEAVKKSGYNFNGVHAPENPTDNWSLSYEKLVVPLVKAVQELSAKNDDLQKQIDELKAMIVSGRSTVDGQPSTVISSASLQQNIPNPFTHTTSIGYTLPQKFTSAQIVITDKNGKKLKAINVSGNGKGSLNVDASTLASGAYQYSLMVDGKLIDTKQMILSR